MTASGRSLRPVGPADRPFLKELAGQAFSHLGQYAQMIPLWIEGPGASGLIALERGRPVGFAITCLTALPESTRDGSSPKIGLDLMAIATVPERRRSGVGGWLLDAVLGEARKLAESMPLALVTLTMEDGNTAALRLFESRGFRPVEGGGAYPRGQIARNYALRADVLQG